MMYNKMLETLSVLQFSHVLQKESRRSGLLSKNFLLLIQLSRPEAADFRPRGLRRRPRPPPSANGADERPPEPPQWAEQCRPDTRRSEISQLGTCWSL